MGTKGGLRERVLLVDDEENFLHFLRKLFEGEGYRVEVARTGKEALEKAKGSDFDLAILDIRLPDLDGMTLLQEFRKWAPEVKVVMMTAYSSIASAVEAMRAGAYDYVTKPFRAEEILKSAEKALEHRRLLREVHHLRREVEKRYSFENIVGKSRAMQEVFHRVEQVAASKSTVLILGESGTGKELVARAIHYRSDRKGGPFVVIDCGTIPENLQESELFGHMKGSFTGAETTTRGLFEEANGGTLFLDEVGNLSESSQAKLLRVLQEGTLRRLGDRKTLHVDLRVIAATNQDLAHRVRRGDFREDLYYRLNVVPIHLPPLRERREDIPLLVHHFLLRNAAGLGRTLKGVSPAAMQLLQSYHWPGNVRELENIIERAVLFSEEEVLTEELLPPEVRFQKEDIRLRLPETPLRLKEAVAKMSSQVERELIEGTLARTGGNRSAAARLLGISRRALLYKLKAFRISQAPRGLEKELNPAQTAPSRRSDGSSVERPRNPDDCLELPTWADRGSPEGGHNPTE